MANGTSSHSASWPILVGLGGLILGIGGSVIWVGGALRQIDINTHRLESLEQIGSPGLQALKADLQSMRVTVSELTRISEKSSETNGQQAQQLATIDESVKALTQDLRVIEQFSRDTSEHRAALASQVAAGEGRLIAADKAVDDLRASMRRLRDDFRQHQHDDEAQLRDQINQLRGIRVQPEKDR